MSQKQENTEAIKAITEVLKLNIFPSTLLEKSTKIAAEKALVLLINQTQP